MTSISIGIPFISSSSHVYVTILLERTCRCCISKRSASPNTCSGVTVLDHGRPFAAFVGQDHACQDVTSLRIASARFEDFETCTTPQTRGGSPITCQGFEGKERALTKRSVPRATSLTPPTKIPTASKETPAMTSLLSPSHRRASYPRVDLHSSRRHPQSFLSSRPPQ